MAIPWRAPVCAVPPDPITVLGATDASQLRGRPTAISTAGPNQPEEGRR